MTVVALAVLAGAVACSSVDRPASSPDLVELSWPAGNPRVRLERVIESGQVRGGGAARFFRRLAGRQRQPGLQRPYAVAWDGDELLVTDPGAGKVLRLTTSGRLAASTRSPFASPVGVAVCASGVAVTDSETGELWLLDRALTGRRLVARDLERPTGVACRGDRLFVVETGRHRILFFDLPTGARNGGAASSPSRTVGARGEAAGAFNYPTSVAVGAGSLWIGDTLNFRLQRLDPATGETRGTFGNLGDAPGEMPRIKGLAVDREGHLWVSDGHLDRVSLFAQDGAFLMDLGGPGLEPGRFSFPTGVAAHADGRVAVIDSLNRRIQIFRLVSPVGDS